MKKSNAIKLLTKDELKKINDTYSFDVDNKNVIVKSRLLGRETKHPKKKKFNLDCSYMGLRKITISTDAIELYLKLNKKYSLIDIQQATNSLYKKRLDITEKSVKNELKNL